MYTWLHVVLSHVTLASRFTHNARICNRGNRGKKGGASATACAQTLLPYRVDGGRGSGMGCVGRRWLLDFFPSGGAAAAARDSAIVFVEEITWAAIQRKYCYGVLHTCRVCANLLNRLAALHPRARASQPEQCTLWGQHRESQHRPSRGWQIKQKWS